MKKYNKCLRSRYMSNEYKCVITKPFQISVEPLLQCHIELRPVGTDIKATLSKMRFYMVNAQAQWSGGYSPPLFHGDS